MTHPGGRIAFNCIFANRKLNSYEWIINGSSLANLTLINVTNDALRNSQNRLAAGFLTFAGVPIEYNVTRIQCTAYLESSPSVPMNSVVSLLLLQGK